MIKKNTRKANNSKRNHKNKTQIEMHPKINAKKQLSFRGKTISNRSKTRIGCRKSYFEVTWCLRIDEARIILEWPEWHINCTQSDLNEPRGCQKRAKWSQKGAKWSQKDARNEPNGDQNALKHRCPKKVTRRVRTWGPHLMFFKVVLDTPSVKMLSKIHANIDNDKNITIHEHQLKTGAKQCPTSMNIQLHFGTCESLSFAKGLLLEWDVQQQIIPEFT